jgi:hypothetical protein
MGVTYRLKNHPDVTLFFQDLGMQPKAGKEDKLNEKDYVRWLWNWQYQWSAVSKEVIKPEWRAITMDGRKGVATFVKSVYKDGSVNYGYVAYVQGDRSARISIRTFCSMPCRTAGRRKTTRQWTRMNWKKWLSA